MYFKHLDDVKQTYTEHFLDSFHYFFTSLKASLYFLIHGMYPDIFITSGSTQIRLLYKEIEEKYKIINKLK